MMAEETTDEEVICVRCGHTGVPNFFDDFYPDGKSNDPNAMICERCMMREAFAEAPSTGGESSPLPTSDWEQSVCKLGQGAATCAFLVLYPDGPRCAKGGWPEPAIRERLAEGTMRAQGDNCSGPPDFSASS